MSEDVKKKGEEERKGGIPLLPPDPERRRRLVELLNGFLEDKISLADLKGISPQKLFLLAEAGYVKFKHGRIKEAEDIYQALILLDRRNAYYHSVMGAIHQKQKRPIEAIIEYSQALKIDKTDISCYVNRGEVYLRHGNFRKAAEDFRQAIILDRTGRDMWANRSRSLVIALRRQVDSRKKKQIIARPVRQTRAPVDAAAKDAGRLPKEATPVPPSPGRVLRNTKKGK